MNDAKNAQFGKLVRLVCLLILASGILLRIVVFLQDRNLILDEVNLVRNLHERDFSALLKPLDYQQFAPVPFILIGKMSASVFGAYEWAVRLFPFLCGLLTLVLFYKLLLKLNLLKGGVYSLLLFASGLIYLRYATEFKQYASDQLTTVCLLLAVLEYGPTILSRGKFVFLWMLFGFLAIWTSMPSVFILAGIGCYFLIQAWKSDRRRQLITTILIVIAFWISQFAANYILFLKPSIGSEYLQNWHRGYFLVAFPTTADDWYHNLNCLSEVWAALGGHWVLSFIANIVLLLAGIYFMAKKNSAWLLVLLLPVGCLFAASMLHLYTLLPRVCLFCFPLLLVLISYGWELIITSKFRRGLVPLFGFSCLVTIINFNCYKHFSLPLKFDLTGDNLLWIRKRQVALSNVYVHEIGWPQVHYLLAINPDSGRWADMKAARPFYWHTNMDSLCQRIHSPAVFTFSFVDGNELAADRAVFDKYLKVQDSIIEPDRLLFFMQPQKL